MALELLRALDSAWTHPRALHGVLVASGLAAATALAGCSSKPGSELGEDACANGADDDGDSLIDCEDPSCALFSWCLGTRDAGAVDAAALDAGPLPDGTDASVCIEPLDVVLVVDVSTSMEGELERIRDQIAAVWTRVSLTSASPQFSLVVFVDDALAVNDCEPFANPEALAGELDAWRAFCATNRSPVSSITNTDCAENSLDAIATAITQCPWREGAEHVVVHVTDDTFAERPAVLSGSFGPGILVASTYDEVADGLDDESIRFAAFARNGEGESCGAGRSADVGRGFHTSFDGAESLPTESEGAVWDLDAVRDGSLDMGAALGTYLESLLCTE